MSTRDIVITAALMLGLLAVGCLTLIYDRLGDILELMRVWRQRP